MADNSGKRDLRSELERDDGKFPPRWDPAPGKILVGLIIRYETAQPSYGPCEVVIIENEEGGGLVTVWLSRIVLKNLFSEHRPRPGERIGLKYLGVDEHKNYHKYRLLMDRPDELHDFDESAAADPIPPRDSILARRPSPDDPDDDISF